MRLISNANRKYELYVHVLSGLEGKVIQFKNFPQCNRPKISSYLLLEIQEIMELKAKELNMYISH